jgi:hypothetical protein
MQIWEYVVENDEGDVLAVFASADEAHEFANRPENAQVGNFGAIVASRPKKQTPSLAQSCSAHGYRIVYMDDHLRIVAIDSDNDGCHREQIANFCGYVHTGDGGGYTFLCPQTGKEKNETWIEVRQNVACA